MIYVTGDTHGKSARLSHDSMPYCERWGRNDTLIICGDFGFLSGQGGEDTFLRELTRRPYTICFLDGNRDNPERLAEFPIVEFHGGRAHRVRRNVYHLMRGEVYDIEGKKLFVMGGGYSMDRARRMEGSDWWPSEMPSAEEYAMAKRNLALAGMQVDAILTHAAPTTVMQGLFQACAEERELNDFLEWVLHNVQFHRWYFGHVHLDAAMPDSKLCAVFLSVRELMSGTLIW